MNVAKGFANGVFALTALGGTGFGVAAGLEHYSAMRADDRADTYAEARRPGTSRVVEWPRR